MKGAAAAATHHAKKRAARRLRGGEENNDGGTFSRLLPSVSVSKVTFICKVAADGRHGLQIFLLSAKWCFNVTTEKFPGGSERLRFTATFHRLSRFYEIASFTVKTGPEMRPHRLLVVKMDLKKHLFRRIEHLNQEFFARCTFFFLI